MAKPNSAPPLSRGSAQIQAAHGGDQPSAHEQPDPAPPAVPAVPGER